MNFDRMNVDRRTAIVGTLSLAGAALVAGSPAVAQSSAEAVAAKMLADPGPLPEQVFGPADAKVTVIEYASLTCHHCKDFHLKTWPQVKEKYVDTGKIRFVMREFPTDPLSMGAFMLARCAPQDRWYAVVDLLFRTDDAWAHAPEPVEGLKKVMSQVGMPAETFDACLKDGDLFKNVQEVSRRGSIAGVTGTPTFFFNGRKEQGFKTLEQFSAIVDPMLG